LRRRSLTAEAVSRFGDATVRDRRYNFVTRRVMLSFIVPAYNEELELPSTLSAIHAAAAMNSEPYEIIVVNDGSTDATATLAATGGARLLTIHRRQIAAARNAGARQAQGDVLFFVDADTRIAPQHVSAALAALRNGCVGGGARMEINEEIPPWARIFVYVFGRLYFAANLGAGAFLFTSRALFERAGGFDEQLFAGEEVYFSRALKKLGRFRLLANPVVTSGRKLRMYPARQVLGGLVGIILRGRRGVRSRDKLDLWYDGKRETEAREPAAENARG
jgi:glycosyltransferase involved in cell wall biosynthesis